jgi:cbb3-type cytochrome oxidase maturation protein
VGFLLAFVWSIKDGQQDDLITPGMRILTEDKEYTK